MMIEYRNQAARGPQSGRRVAGRNGPHQEAASHSTGGSAGWRLANGNAAHRLLDELLGEQRAEETLSCGRAARLRTPAPGGRSSRLIRFPYEVAAKSATRARS